MAHKDSLEKLQSQAHVERAEADDHTRRAHELEQRIERERRQAQFHEQRAAETEDEREAV